MIPLENLEVFQLAEKLADKVWEIVAGWEWFAKSTVGKQLVEAADSVGANIAEGYGRFHFRDKLKFSYYGRGSLSETRYWLRRAYSRDLFDEKHVNEIKKLWDALAPKLNSYISATRSQMKKSSTD